MIDCGGNLSFKSSELDDIPFISNSYRANLRGYIRYQIAKCISQITKFSDKALEMVIDQMSFSDFKDKLLQKEYNVIMVMILPNLCKSASFLQNMKRNKEKTLFLSVIFDQLNSNDEERIIVGINCLKTLNDKSRDFLHLEHKEFFRNLSECVRSENDKIK
jgi:hypothetical protein